MFKVSNVLGIRWKDVMERCLIHDFSDMVDDATVGCSMKQWSDNGEKEAHVFVMVSNANEIIDIIIVTVFFWHS